MKKFCTLAFIAVSLMVANAQLKVKSCGQLQIGQETADDHKYLPLVREGVEWHYQFEDNNPITGTKYDVFYRFDGTEYIDGNKYFVLYRYLDREFNKSKAQIAAYMYENEDNESVFSICQLSFDGQNINCPKMLAYDFATQSTNDEFKCGEVTMSIKSAIVEGVSRKVVYQDNTIWAIEGIGMATREVWWGYLAYPMLTMPSAYPCESFLLLDVKEIETGKYLYRYDDFFGSVESTAISSNQLSVSISGGQLTVSGVDNCSSITIRDTSGRTVSSAKANTINVSGLEKGMYIVSAISTSGKTQSKVVAIH